MRAFASSLQLPPGRLSEVFSGKRPITAKMAQKIAQNLAASSDWHQAFSDSVRNSKQIKNYKLIDSDEFAIIADWYHFAILSLMETDDFSSKPQWIAKRLGISKVQVELAIDRLHRLQFIKRDDKGHLSLQLDQAATTSDIPSGALKASHKQTLEQAIDSLETVNVLSRDITSMSMAIDPKRLPEAKKMIRDFRRKLAHFLEQGERTEVYNLNIQVVPVTK